LYFFLLQLIAKADWNSACTSDFGDSFIYLGAYFQQGINPILVIIAQSEFRQAVWAMFRCRSGQK
jgi:hypothetical protein